MIRRLHDVARPRVAGEREGEILDATLELLLEAGYDRLTMDAVAGRSKASKATLYRRWCSKSALVVDALLRSKRSPDLHDVDTGSLRGDLLATFCGPGGMTERDNAKMLAAVMTALHTDDEFAAEFRERYLAPKIEISHRIYARAAARGELAEGVDLGLVGPALAGILLHRSFLLGEQVDTKTIEKVVDQIILPAATGRTASSPKESS
ncbi:MAG: TetR/AcrR family transcriptional regulator [Nocardioidaceae bacterium]